jgi:hypothetical protein
MSPAIKVSGDEAPRVHFLTVTAPPPLTLRVIDPVLVTSASKSISVPSMTVNDGDVVQEYVVPEPELGEQKSDVDILLPFVASVEQLGEALERSAHDGATKDAAPIDPVLLPKNLCPVTPPVTDRPVKVPVPPVTELVWSAVAGV